MKKSTADPRDVGTIGAYLEAHMDLLASPPRFELCVPGDFDRSSPLGRSVRHDISLCLTTQRCHLQGYCRRVVMSDGARIERGAHVEDAVLLEGAVVGAGAFVRRAIVDRHARVERGAVVDGEAGLAVVPARAAEERAHDRPRSPCRVGNRPCWESRQDPACPHGYILQA